MSGRRERQRFGIRARLRRALRPKQTTRSVDPQARAVISFQGTKQLEVPHGTTILQAARALDVSISHYCGGMASCGTCRVEIIDGADALSDIDGRETMVLGSQSAAAGNRLACQARILGAVTVKVPRWF